MVLLCILISRLFTFSKCVEMILKVAGINYFIDIMKSYIVAGWEGVPCLQVP